MKTIAAAAIAAAGTFIAATAIAAEPQATKTAKVREIMKPVVSEAAKAPVALTEAEMDRIRGGGLAVYVLFVYSGDTSSTTTSTIPSHSTEWTYPTLGDPGITL